MLDKNAMEEAAQRWNAIAHPLHSLGKMEDDIIKIAGITGSANMHLQKKALLILCADNGVVAEGITQTGQEVTAIVAENFLTEGATAAIMCKKTGADIFPIDIGMVRDTRVRNLKVAYGTKNIVKEPAMTKAQTRQAIETGKRLVKECKEQGYGILATGEMGIGNTTTSSAVASVLLERPVEEMTGRGAGLSRTGLQRKREVISQAIALHHPDKEDGIDVLAKVGGLDIAGMAGIFLGAEEYHLPVLIDGFISGVAALVAQRISPTVTDALLATHVSQEPAAEAVLQELGLTAGLRMEMCLGEGSGAVAYFPLLDLAEAVYTGMGTFHENAIETYEEFEQ